MSRVRVSNDGRAFIWNSLKEGALASACGVAAVAVALWRLDWWGYDQTLPQTYFADPVQSANMVYNAQTGNPFFTPTLGAPLGQQLGLSAYGVEWPQSMLAGVLAPAQVGPWLALNRYMLLSYFLAGAFGYLGARWVGVRRATAFIVGLCFSLVPLHLLFSVSWFTLGNYAASALFVAIFIRLASGTPLTELVPRIPANWSSGAKTVLGVAAIAFCGLASAVGGNYFMWFNGLIALIVGTALLARRAYWRRALRVWLVGVVQLSVIVAVALPIVVARKHAGLSMAEPSTSDRRAFAALANGGELFSAFLPSAGSVSHKWLERFPVFSNFVREYYSSQLIIAKDYQGGLVVVFAVLALGAWGIGLLRRGDAFTRVTPLSGVVQASVLLLGASALLYLRGGFGSFFAFIFPSIRAYDRVVILVVFSSLLVLAGLAALPGIRSVARRLITVALILVLLDAISGMHPPGPANRDQRLVIDLGNGLQLTSLGPTQTKELVKAANKLMPAGCSVLVLPAVTYPVDFTLGVTSYVGYETIKPGLLGGTVGWTAGGIPGTPNAQWNDELVARFRAQQFASAIDLAADHRSCGALLFTSLQSVIAQATAGTGSPHGAPEVVQAALRKRYGDPCYADLSSQVELYCE